MRLAVRHKRIWPNANANVAAVVLNHRFCEFVGDWVVESRMDDRNEGRSPFVRSFAAILFDEYSSLAQRRKKYINRRLPQKPSMDGWMDGNLCTSSVDRPATLHHHDEHFV
jgi:hypothetical protein